jgi:hypothetical protein
MPVVIDEAISRQSPPNDPASVAAMVPFDSRFAYFRTAAFVVGLLRLDQKIVTRRADVIESRGERARHRTALFRNSAIAFRCMAIGRYRCSRTGRRSRCRYSRGHALFRENGALRPIATRA